MIHFFPRYRQRFLKESRFTRYLVYAIGEIVLVVIGILIALQINNWNEERQVRKKQQILLQGMYNELGKDVEMMDEYITGLNRATPIRKAVFLKSNLENVSLDSLLFLNLQPNLDTELKSLIFDKAANLGITQFSQNDSLNAALENYYVNETDRFKRITNYYQEFNKKELEYNLKHLSHPVLDHLFASVGIENLIDVNDDTLSVKQKIIAYNQENEVKNMVQYSLIMQEYTLRRFELIRDSTIKPLRAQIDRELNTDDD